MLRQNRNRQGSRSRNRIRATRNLETLENRQLMAADCIDFEDLAVGTEYFVGDTFVADNSGFQATITGEDFTWSNGINTSGGIAVVEPGSNAGHSGNDIQVNNILLDFDFGSSPNGLTMNFGEFGGNLNLNINGDFVNFEDFQDIHGANIGGTLISVSGGGGNDQGVLTIDGTVNEFKIGGQELWIDHICPLEGRQEGEFDWGDAPDEPYPTLSANNGAVHVIDPDVFLGSSIDAEADGQPTMQADGDDLATIDDEDGVTFLTPLVPGGTATVEVVASVDGALNAWIDFDRNGVWATGTSEEIFFAQPLSAGSNILSFVVPNTAKPAPNEATYSRWRFSTTDRVLKPDGVSATGAIPNGEVEDHLAFIRENSDPDRRLDWGDAPDQPYPTLAANNGAVHEINPDVFLGTRIDAEPDGQPTAAADGDDLTTVDDEDGVTFLTPLIPGSTAQVRVVTSTRGWLNAWVDFDRNGSWTTAAPEEIFTGQLLGAGVNVLNFNVPATAVPAPNEATYSRWRFSTTDQLLAPEGISPTGAYPDGEVEDHLAFIEDRQDPPHPVRLDWGDAPDSPYPTLAASNGAVHEINPRIYLGSRVDAELDGQPSPLANRDDMATSDDEDGVTFLTPLMPGSTATVQIEASVDGWLNAWVDFDRDGVWTPGSAEEIFFGQPVAAGINVLTFNVPATAIPGPNEATFSRWRFSRSDQFLAPDGISPTGLYPNGEVEDHLAFIHDRPDPQRLDWGDAPERPYPTTAANNGAVHLIDPDVYMGATVDAELDGQPSPLANRDDAVTSDDEDGVTFLTPLTPGSTADVQIVASVDGWLNAWIDFDRDGVWSPGTAEEIFSGQVVAGGVNVLTFNVPAFAEPSANEPAFSRWRFSTTDVNLLPTGGSINGELPNGEVEDHIVRITERPPLSLDFGDAPERPYPTTLARDGARHIINPDIFLGSRIDAEADGQPSFDAQRDDAVGMDDEDGIRFVTPMVPGSMAVVEAIASTDARLDAWVDFNQDGTWDASEQIVVSAPTVAGSNLYRFLVPTSAFPAANRPAYARFRLSTSGGLSPTGLARDGEVEDYAYLNGDLNADLQIDHDDIGILCGGINGGAAADLNGDGATDHDDLDYLIHDVLNTYYGDANLDGSFNASDLIVVFASGEFRDGIANNSTWMDGDWNCDGEFNESDLIRAFSDGGYGLPAVAAALVDDDSTSNVEHADASRENKISLNSAARRRAELQVQAIDRLFATN